MTFTLSILMTYFENEQMFSCRKQANSSTELVSSKSLRTHIMLKYCVSARHWWKIIKLSRPLADRIFWPLIGTWSLSGTSSLTAFREINKTNKTNHHRILHHYCCRLFKSSSSYYQTDMEIFMHFLGILTKWQTYRKIINQVISHGIGFGVK